MLPDDYSEMPKSVCVDAVIGTPEYFKLIEEQRAELSKIIDNLVIED